MSNVLGVAYPIHPSVRERIASSPILSKWIRITESEYSSLEIIRVLGNTHYEHLDNLIEFIENSSPAADSIIQRLLRQTGMSEFEGALSELYLLNHIERFAPGRCTPAGGLQSDKKPDLIVNMPNIELAIEIYGPKYLFGFQYAQQNSIQILKYLEINVGYELSAKFQSINDLDFSYALEFGLEKDIRPWLDKLASRCANWLTQPSPESCLKCEGPTGAKWVLSIELISLHRDRRIRRISMSTPTRSDDARLTFEIGDTEATASSWWGKAVARKMWERQAGASPSADRIRLLVIDFMSSDTAFPDFFCWPSIAKRIDGTVRLLATKDGRDLPYDVVQPASLTAASCFGAPIWLSSNLLRQQTLFEEVGLTVPCSPRKPEQMDWSDFI